MIFWMNLDDFFIVGCMDFHKDLVSIRYFPLIMHRPGGTSGCESLSRSCIPIVFIFSVGLVFRVWVPTPKTLVSSLFTPPSAGPSGTLAFLVRTPDFDCEVHKTRALFGLCYVRK